jgi:hypothetical protein
VTNANLVAGFGAMTGVGVGGAAGVGGAGGAAGALGAGGAGGSTLPGKGGALAAGGDGGKGGKGGAGGGGGAGGDGGMPGGCPTWCDSLTAFGGSTGGTYDVTPGLWTYNGELVGLTYRNGETHAVPPNQSVCACIEYSELWGDPNDFHFIGNRWISPDGVVYISCWSFWYHLSIFNFTIEFYIPIFPGNFFMDFTYDFRPNPNDPQMIVKQNGVVVYSGSRSAFNPGPLNLRQISFHTVRDTAQMDCNNNSINDLQEIQNNPALDCNFSGTLDMCDIANGFSLDLNHNNVPDECDGAAGFHCHTCYGDANGDGRVNLNDIPRLAEELVASSHFDECVDANQDSKFDGHDVDKSIDLMLANNGAGTDCPNIYNCAGAIGASESPHETPGCAGSCCEAVCAANRFCCDVEWDEFCALLADKLCRQNGASTPETCVPIGDGTFVGTTANNTPGSDITSCTFGDTIAEWYCYGASCTGTATASLCNSLYDCSVAVFDGYPGPPTTELACNDDFDCDGAGPVEMTSKVSWSVIAGNTYYIRVSGYQGATGSYTLTTSCTAGTIGACCVGGGGCSATTQSGCQALGGLYQGDATTCPGTCPPSVCDNVSRCQLAHVISNTQQGGYVSDTDNATFTADDFRPRQWDHQSDLLARISLDRRLRRRRNLLGELLSDHRKPSRFGAEHRLVHPYADQDHSGAERDVGSAA